MRKIAIIGHFATYQSKNDGQTVKTRNIHEQLKKNKNYKIEIVDTQHCKKKIFKFIKSIFKTLKRNETIIIVVSKMGTKVLIPILACTNLFYKRKIAFCVVGSWFDQKVEQSKFLAKVSKKLDRIFVETLDLKENLEKMNFKNVEIMYNFKVFDELEFEKKEYKQNCFCTFSRVNKKKGINDAIYAIEKLKKNGYNVFLDIYGPIEKEYEEEFKEILKNVDNCIKYKGNIEPKLSREILSKYEALIFPTHYIKEGLPGTLIDAYSSETPVISSDWISAKEFVPDSVGIRYDFANKDALYNTLKKVVEDKKIMLNKRKKCLEFVKKFSPEIAIKPLIEFLEV